MFSDCKNIDNSKLIGYNLVTGALTEYVGSSLKTFTRNPWKPETGTQNQMFTGEYKRGDVVFIGKYWDGPAYLSSRPRFLYNNENSFRINSDFSGNILSSNTLDNRNPNDKGINALAGVMFADELRQNGGVYYPEVDNDMRIGEFAGFIKLKSLFPQRLAIKYVDPTTNKNWTRFVGTACKIYEVTDNAIRRITFDDLTENDFVYGYISNQKIDYLVRYNDIRE